MVIKAYFLASNILIHMRIIILCLSGRTSTELIQILMCSLTVITVKDALLLKYVSADNPNHLFMPLKGISLLLKHYLLIYYFCASQRKARTKIGPCHIFRHAMDRSLCPSNSICRSFNFNFGFLNDKKDSQNLAT